MRHMTAYAYNLPGELAENEVRFTPRCLNLATECLVGGGI